MSVSFGAPVALLSDASISEQIFRQEVEDGIANAAQESALAWAMEAAEQKRSDPFVRDLLRLTQKCMSDRQDGGSEAAAAAEEAPDGSSGGSGGRRSTNSKLKGGMGAVSRVQPRYQKGAAAYDKQCAERSAREEEATRAHEEARRGVASAAEKEIVGRQQLKPGWKPKFSVERMQMFYLHDATGEISWEKPLSDVLVGCEEADQAAQCSLENVIADAGGGNGNEVNDDDDDDDDDDDSPHSAIVIHVGNTHTMVGFAGDDAPRAVFPSVVGAPKHSGIMVGMDQKEAYVGDEAQVKRGVLTLRRPMESGLIMDFDGFGKLLHHAFYNELRVDPSEHAVIITSRALAPKSQRERLTQILFEDLGIAALHVENAQCLSLYASGRTTGVVVDIGATGVDVVPLYEGYPLPHAVSSSSSISGMAVTNYLQVILTERGYSFTTTAEREIIQDIKEKFCEAKQQQQQQEQSTPGEGATAVQEKQYELPDGNTVAIGDECFRASEVLFSPLDGSLGLADLVFQTIMKVDVDIRKDLFGNIILAGGGSLLSGLEARLTSELTALAPSTMRIRLIAPPERKFSSWIGGSILASLSTFQPMWLPRSVYEEMGPSCIHGASLEGAKIKKEAKQRSKNKEATAAQKAAAEREAFQTEVDEMMEKALASTAKRAGANGGAEVVATKPLADPNSLVVHCGAWLSSQEQVRDRGGGASAAEQARTTLRCNPFNCAGCEAVLDATTMASASQGDASGSSFVMLESWHCSFCGVCNVIDAAAIGEALGDTSFNIADLDDEINYLLPASCDSVGPAAGSQIDAVAFVVDCSGSMGVTQEVHGEVPFLEKGAAATAPTNSSLIEAGTDRPLSQQRLPREQRNVTHVSRMVCAKAAMMDQINSLTKNDEGVCADLVTFSGSVELIGDGSVTELSIEGGRLNDMNAVRAAAQRFAASSLPSHASTSTGSTNQGAVRDDECAICLEKVDRSTACTLPCSHTFHASCLEKLQKFNRDRWGGEDKVPWNSCCPTCRAKMPSDCGNADAKAGECSAGGSDLASLSACIEKLEESGPTALGPALLCAVELLKARGGVAGGRLVLLTDGLANVGLGNLEDHPETAEGFYSRVGTEAAAAGVAINVVAIDSTAEGTSTKVGLEFLGGLADATGGSVELVSALDLASSALGAGAAAEKTLASRASIVVLVGEPFPLSCPPASEKPRSVQHFTRELGRVTPTTDLALNYQVSAVPAASNHGGEQIVVPIQVQFRYTLPNGEVHVRVRTLRQPVVTDRHLAEQGVDAHVSSVAAIQSAAILAEQGNYEAARILMLSHIRLLQRSMCTVSGQEAYLNFVVTAERLDQFMRQKAEEEALLRNTLLHTNNKPGDQASLAEASKTDGATARRSDRDDDSSSAIFQMKRISLATFRNARTATH